MLPHPAPARRDTETTARSTPGSASKPPRGPAPPGQTGSARPHARPARPDAVPHGNVRTAPPSERTPPRSAGCSASSAAPPVPAPAASSSTEIVTRRAPCVTKNPRDHQKDDGARDLSRAPSSLAAYPPNRLISLHFLRERTRHHSGRGLRGGRRRLEPLGRLDLDVVIPIDAGPGRDEMPDDDVLLETEEVVLGPANRRVGQHPRGLLERRRGNERLRRETRLGDAEQQRLGGGRLGALLHRPLVDLTEGQLVHVLPLEEHGAARIHDAHLLQHLPHDDADVLVVDLHALQPVHLLHFVQEVLLHRPRPLDPQDVVRVDGALGEAVAACPCSSAICAPSGTTESRSRFFFSPFFWTPSMCGCSFLSRSSMITRWRRPVSSSSSSRTVSSSTMSTNRTTPGTSVRMGLVYGSHVNSTPSFATFWPSPAINVAPSGTWTRECTESLPSSPAPRFASHVSTERIFTASMPASSIACDVSSAMSFPASTSTLGRPSSSSSWGSSTSSSATLPTRRSRSGSMMSSPSFSAAISRPRIVPQSSSVTVTSCATSTRRRVR